MGTVTDAIVAYALTDPHCGARTPALVRTLIDTVGVAVGGTSTREYSAVEAWSRTTPSPGSATVWARSETASPSRAALLNGMAAHALDFDDAAPSTPLHPGAVLWPAVLAEAEGLGSSWSDARAAVDVGQSVVRTIAALLPSEVHYGRGWHTTATVGRLAATAALVRLRHGSITDDQARHALGIAASASAGLLANFGSGTKPLHAGLAARDAVDAVGLALAGVTADHDVLDGPRGFLAVYGDPAADTASRVHQLLGRWAEEWPSDTSVKRYPSCYATHRAVDAALAVREQLGGSAARAERVVVEVHPLSLRPLIAHAPTTPSEARFSLAHTVASALVDGDLALGSFTSAAVQRPAVVALRERVEVVVSPSPADGPDLDGAIYARVRITTPDGTVEDLVTSTRGSARLPLDDAQLEAKLRSCTAAAGWGGSATAALLDTLRAATGYGPVVLDPLRRTAEEVAR